MSGSAGEGKAAGNGALTRTNPKIDIEELARKVYALMLNDARLSSHRLGSPRKPGRNGRL